MSIKQSSMLGFVAVFYDCFPQSMQLNESQNLGELSLS